MDSEKLTRTRLISEVHAVYKQISKMKAPRAAELTPAIKRKLDHCLDIQKARLYALQVAVGPVRDAELDLMNERLNAIEARFASLGGST